MIINKFGLILPNSDVSVLITTIVLVLGGAKVELSRFLGLVTVKPAYE